MRKNLKISTLLLSIVLWVMAPNAVGAFNPTNLSSRILNASFEENFDGWENNGFKTQNNSEAAAGKVGRWYAERYVAAPAALPNSYVRQTVKNLPTGRYNVTVRAHAELQGTSDAITGVYFFVDNQKVTVNGTAKTYTIPVAITAGQQITIGLSVEGTNANWVTVDHFQIVKTDGGIKGTAKPLNRGLMALNLVQSGGTGNLVSWRIRKTDNNYSFKLYRGDEYSQTFPINGGAAIKGKSNFRDANGTVNSYYKLEVLNGSGTVVETMVSGKTWDNQTLAVPTTAPTDTRFTAWYTPNDASFCDMDGDGEYEIILKWEPDNAKDAAKDGNTSDNYFDCIKLDGTLLWRINTGPNIRSGAHTSPFVAWDLDGDGYGEFMVKTAPGTVDGNGNMVSINGEDPLQNCLSGRKKPDHGPEYITVFDGLTGAAISTIYYHTDYAAGSAYWGDSKQNRSERYTACVAYLDGENKKPSAIFNRGYYNGAFVGAYDFDGTTLKLRWLSRNISSGQGLYGEGAHWLTAADLDGDGFHEIQFGSAALDHNGNLLYRTGLGHGDAFHISDFLPDRPGLEMFMAHEEKPYGVDLRDAKTGQIIIRETAGGDTGRGLAAHFDSSTRSSQYIHSATGEMKNCNGGGVNASSWALGSSGAGINCRIYWDGDLYDEFFDKSLIAHWNPSTKNFDRFKFNGGGYLWGNLNNATKNNPCVLGDMLGDWREEIVTWDGNNRFLLINATDQTSNYPVYHLMDDIQYRENIISQNVGYNQPPHLSFDPSIVFTGKEAPADPEITIGDLLEGTYYIQNVETGKFLTAGNAWGTKAILGDHAINFNVVFSGGMYNFDSQIANSSTNHYLTADDRPFVDGAASGWNVRKVDGDIFYITYMNGSTEMALCAPDNGVDVISAALPSTNRKAQWRFLDRNAMLANMQNAALLLPKDGTWLIADANFGRNNTRINQWSYAVTKGGEDTNQCAEVFHKAFNASQTITGVPNGVYKLTCQGFYRADNNNTNEHAYLYASSNGKTEKAYLMNLNEGGTKNPKANSMTEASQEFSSGEYNQEVMIEVTDGSITVGIQTTNTEDWTIFDNFVLTYLGTGSNTLKFSTNSIAEWRKSTTSANEHFQVNTWSTEGNTDGSEMKTPFIENWVGQPSTLGSTNISHDALTGMPDGYYIVNMRLRLLGEAGNGTYPTGASIYANGNSINIKGGQACANGYWSEYPVAVHVTDGTLNFGVNLANPNFNWLSMKDVTVDYYATAAEMPVLTTLPEGSKMEADVASALATAKTNYDADKNDVKFNAYQNAYQNALASMEYYRQLKAEIDEGAALAATLDATGLAAYNAHPNTIAAVTGYENGTYTAGTKVIDKLHEAYIPAVKAQDTPGSDMTIIVNQAASTTNGWTVKNNLGSAKFQYDTWAKDANGMDKDATYMEYWILKPGTLPNNTISYSVDGLHAGSYQLTMETAVNDENSSQVFNSGVSMFVNGEKVSICDGTSASQFNGPVGVHKVNFDLTGSESTITFGIETENTSYNWVSFRNITLTYVGDAITRELGELIAQAQAVADEYEPKVGYRPFVYPLAPYKQLAKAIEEETKVYQEGDVTEEALEAARIKLQDVIQAMRDAQLNPIAPEATYYLEFADNNGVGTGLYMDMTDDGASNTVLSARPFEIKLQKSGDYYMIVNPENDYVIAEIAGSNSGWGNASIENIQIANSQLFEVQLQSDGSVMFANQNASFKNWGWHLGALQNASGGEVSCYKWKAFPVSSKWIIRDVPVLRGDVDMDHDVDTDDLKLLVKIVMGQESIRRSSDVNEDGETSISDVTDLINILNEVSK